MATKSQCLEEIKIDKIFENLIPALKPDELKQLEANLIRDGKATNPLIVWRKGDDSILVDGHNRYEICERLNLPYEVTELEFNDRSEVEEWIIKHQFGQRNMAPIDKAAMVERLEEVIRARAKENQKQSQGRGIKGSATLPNLNEPVDTRKELAKLAKLSEGTMAKAKKILRAVSDEKLPPETIQKIRDKEESINSVFKQLKEIERPNEPIKEESEVSWKQPDIQADPNTKPLSKKQIEALGPCMGMMLARRAVWELEKIEAKDQERQAAFNFVKEWISGQE